MLSQNLWNALIKEKCRDLAPDSKVTDTWSDTNRTTTQPKGAQQLEWIRREQKGARGDE